VPLEGSVTRWLAQLRAGDQEAARPLWERYFQRLVGLARVKLRGAPRRAADEEDVALSALDSFFRGAEHGRFPRLDDRDDLWRLLMVITARKASHLIRDESRQKRGGGPFALGAIAGLDPAELEQIRDPEPPPELVAQVAEECQRLLACLEDPVLTALARWKMEGFTNDEIAARLGCAPRTVERKLRLIRAVWEKEGVS
jgi:DNA-directed RNA polymerase specialized sigma24 family protein